MFRKLATIGGTFGAIAILVGGIGAIMMLGQLRPDLERQDAEIIAPTVFYTTAEAQAVTLDVTAQGEVRPRTDISLTAQVSGRVISISDVFVNGGAFEEGDVLMRIEDTDYRAAAATAKARVAQTEQALRREEAEADLAREDFDDLGRSDAPTELTLRIPQLAQARADFEAARAEFRAAEINLDRTVIRAPFKGRVRERIAGFGQFVSTGSELGRIFSTDIAEIRLPLTDSDLAKLGMPIDFAEDKDNPGPPVELSTVIAGEFHRWEGRIARTEGAIDAATRQIFTIAVVEDPYGAGSDKGAPLAMGLFVDARIEGQPYENAITLPRTALHGSDRVYVIDGGDLLQERDIVIISSGRDTITLSSGVNPGERIAASPLRGARSGDKVTPVDLQAIDGTNANVAELANSRGATGGSETAGGGTSGGGAQ